MVNFTFRTAGANIFLGFVILYTFRTAGACVDRGPRALYTFRTAGAKLFFYSVILYIYGTAGANSYEHTTPLVLWDLIWLYFLYIFRTVGAYCAKMIVCYKYTAPLGLLRIVKPSFCPTQFCLKESLISISKAPAGRKVYSRAGPTHLLAPAGRQVYRTCSGPSIQAPSGATGVAESEASSIGTLRRIPS